MALFQQLDLAFLGQHLTKQETGVQTPIKSLLTFSISLCIDSLHFVGVTNPSHKNKI